MERISVEILKRRLRNTTWIPLGIMAALFLVAMGTMLLRQHRSHMKSIGYAFDEIIRSQETQISQDIFLDQQEGIEVRIQALLESWRKKYPQTQACIQYLILPTEAQSLKTGGACAFQADAIEVLGLHPSESLKISVGNKTFAELRYAVIRPTNFFDVFPPVLLVILVVGMIVAILSHSSLVRGVEDKVLSPLLQQISRDERDAAIADTARMLAHDIRKPFHLVQLALVRLKETKNSQARKLGQEISSEIEFSMRSVDSMLRDILDVSRKMRPNLETVSVSSLVDRLAEMANRFYPDSKVKLVLDFRRRHHVHGDAEQLMRVLTNLVDNAYQAVENSGTIRVAVKEVEIGSSKRIQFSVQNNGPVIAEQDLGKLFTPYFTKRKDGTGLGLTIAKKIVEEHGGSMSCVSDSEKGTCFSFLLNSASDKAVKPAPVLPSKDRKRLLPKDKHFLVFDDEKIVRDIWMRHFKKHGFQTVLAFKSWEDFIGQEGFQLVEPDTIAFVDIHYKGSRYSGVEIANSLRKLGVSKIYAITGDEKTALSSGAFTEVFGKGIPASFNSLVG